MCVCDEQLNVNMLLNGTGCFPLVHACIKDPLLYLYINTGWWSLSRLPSTFAPANTHANVFFVFLPVTLFRQIVTLRGITLPIAYNVPFAEHLGRPKIAHESHNDVRRLWWHAGATFVLLAELGLRKPLSGNPEGLGLLGEEGCTLNPAFFVYLVPSMSSLTAWNR